jgi:hypothetical protein
MVYVSIWEYGVNDEHQEEFEKFYGPKGIWVELFANSDGFITSDLHQDLSNK